ncbi:DUF58 domain-containing protein [Rossellomorea sp. YZS02]|uniref:DUF58 domain-containing protein n=1 Tax=Rossellomorea sp. YZS02 TaxID=3097358 RepID=UPI002A0EBF75|nr:DUF58 domain-containing protein [Rossellomorea sp. YZS02]MDX8344869.1 DUF58 domain-containing protein [Rossellomorea sp. YZS02]
MTFHKEPPFIFAPLVLVLNGILIIISSFAGYDFLVFLFFLIYALALFSRSYLNVLHEKISWSVKKYHDATSIDETITCYIELRNDSVFPMYRLKMNIETWSDRELVFIDGEGENSIYSVTMDLPPKSQMTIPITMKGKSRGIHTWSNLEFALRDPLSLQTDRVEYGDTGLPSFKILPRIGKIADMKLKSMLQGYKQTNYSLFLDETSIIGTKDYENESFRHIHWLATAKESKLLAKKYQKVHGDVYSIFLNMVGAGHFHLRKDMEELIEYTVSVCLYLIKEGCKVELWVNYTTEHHEIMRLKNDLDRTRLRKLIETLALINPNGRFLSTERFYQLSLKAKDNKSLGLIIGTPPEPTRRDELLHIKM